MARLPTLTDNQQLLLRELGEGLGRAYANDHRVLEKKGLILIHNGRFGDYTQITDAGRTYLARMASSQVVGLPGGQVPAPVSKKPASSSPGSGSRVRPEAVAAASTPEHLLRAAPARSCRKRATQAEMAPVKTNTSPRPAPAGVSAAKRGTSPTRPSGRGRGASPRR